MDTMSLQTGGRVLIADESSLVRTLLCSALEGAGYWVEEAQETEAARDLLESHRHDLVVTNLGLPRHEGFELLRDARATGAAVVVLSASVSSDLHARAVGLGADAFLAKSPGVEREVVAAAGRILGAPASQPRSRRAAVMGYIGAFAKTGDPNRGGLPPWPRYDPAKSELMMFTPDAAAIVQADPWKSRLDLIERALDAPGVN